MRWHFIAVLATVDPEVPLERAPVWKLALLTWIGLWPTVTLMMWKLRPQLSSLPVAAQTLIMTALIVPLMTWVLMPSLTHLFRGWLQRVHR